MSEPVALYLRRRGVVRLRNGNWQEEFPVADLDRKIGFYRGLCDLRKGASRKFYQPTVDVLERVRADVFAAAEKADV